jgi:hypothetical protein
MASVPSYSSAASSTSKFLSKIEKNLEINQELYSVNKDYQLLVERVQQLIDGSDHEKSKLQQLKDIAYEVFAGTEFVRKELSYHYKVLWMIFFTNNSFPEDVASVLLRTYEDFLVSKEEPTSQSSEREFPVLAENEEMISVSYGGGVKFFQVFCEGNHQGYANEADGRGMFVTIHPLGVSNSYNQRDWQYAQRTPLLHFDEPFTLKGEIPAKYLHRVNHNSYEAVIFAKDVSHLKVLKKEEIPPILDCEYFARKQMVKPMLPIGSFWSDNGFPTQIFDAIESQYDKVRLERIREQIYDLYK